MLTKSLQGYVSQWLSCKMQLLPEKLLFNFPGVKTKAQQQKVQFNHFAPNPITEAARYWAKAQKAAGNASSGTTVNAEAADNESQAKRSQHVFSHGSVAKWLKACCWGLGHNGRDKSLSHHACQVKASTFVLSYCWLAWVWHVCTVIHRDQSRNCCTNQRMLI